MTVGDSWVFSTRPNQRDHIESSRHNEYNVQVIISTRLGDDEGCKKGNKIGILIRTLFSIWGIRKKIDFVLPFSVETLLFGMGEGGW